jgi:hypothetical protein
MVSHCSKHLAIEPEYNSLRRTAELRRFLNQGMEHRVKIEC